MRESLAMNQSPGRDLPAHYASVSNVPVRAPFNETKPKKNRENSRVILPPILNVPSVPVLATASALPALPAVLPQENAIVPPASALQLDQVDAVAPMLDVPIPAEKPSWIDRKELASGPEMDLLQTKIPIPQTRPDGLALQELSALKQEIKEVIRYIPEKKLVAVAKKLLDEVY